nr:O-antigen ligase family protein [uncultured Psychroserpens sp.]
MKVIIQLIALMMITWGVTSFSLVAFGSGAGSAASAFTYLILLGYYFISEKRKLLFPFIILGLTYYMISGFVYVESSKYFINEIIKYFIIIVCGAELARNTSVQQLCLFLALGSLSILIHATVFADGYGRYSGFYLDPNGASFICLIGYSLSYSIKNTKLKYLYIILFTLSGILTFSRYFLVMWLFVSIIAIVANKKNAQGLFLGFGSLIFILSLATVLQLNTKRLSMLESIFDKDSTEVKGFSEDSRTATWSQYTDDILTNPIFGNGYKALSGGARGKQGVHNTYLMTIGESGFIPFLILIGIYLFILKKSIPHLYTKTHLPLMALALVTLLMVIHNYFDNEVLLFISIWVFVNVIKPNDKSEDIILKTETQLNN